MKKFLVLGAVVILVVVGIVIYVNATKEDLSGDPIKLSDATYVETKEGLKVNTSDALKNAKMLGSLKITNIELTTDKNNKTRILADVENTSSSATEMKYVKVAIMDKTGKEITSVSGVIVPLEAGGKTQLNVNVTSNYPNAYDFKITEE